MDLPVTTASAEARASLASYGRLACLGARIIAGLTVKARDEGEDAWGHLDGKSPSVGAAFRALLAATHAARECVAAGTGGDARAAGVGARVSMTAHGSFTATHQHQPAASSAQVNSALSIAPSESASMHATA